MRKAITILILVCLVLALVAVAGCGGTETAGSSSVQPPKNSGKGKYVGKW